MATGIIKKTRLFLRNMAQEILFVDAMADAVTEGGLRRINFMVLFGADINHVSKENVVENDDTARGGIRRTILSRGEGYGFTSGIDTATFLYLVKKGMDPNQTCRNENNFIARNIRNISCEEIRSLVKAGVDPNFKSGSRQIPLSFSLLNIEQTATCKEKVLTLIDCGMDINAQDVAGNTIAHMICGRHAYSEFFFLLDQGLRLDITNNDGETPIDIAQKHLAADDPDFVRAVQTYADLDLKKQFDKAVRQAAGGLSDEQAHKINAKTPALSAKRIKVRI